MTAARAVPPRQPRRAGHGGGARHQAQCIAQPLGELGATVVLADRLDLVHETAAALAREGARTDAVVLDVTDRAAVDAAIDGVVARHGRIDALVANAGWSYEEDGLSHSDEDWQQALNINLTGVFHAVRRAGRHMVAQRSGAVVALSSIAGVKYVRPERHVGYDVAKAGVAHLCRVLGCEWAPMGVRVNAVGPATPTPRCSPKSADPAGGHAALARRYPDVGRLRREEIAASIAFLLSDAASGITGQLVMVDAGYSAARCEGRDDDQSGNGRPRLVGPQDGRCGAGPQRRLVRIARVVEPNTNAARPASPGNAICPCRPASRRKRSTRPRRRGRRAGDAHALHERADPHGGSGGQARVPAKAAGA